MAAPLVALAPPPGLWERIDAALPGAPAPRPAASAPAMQGVPRWWRLLAVSATAALAGVLAILVLPPPERRAEAQRLNGAADAT